MSSAVRVEAELWQSIRSGDASRARELLPELPAGWLREHADGAVALAKAQGQFGLAEVLLGAKTRALQAGASSLDRDLRESVSRARASAAASAGKLIGEGLMGASLTGSTDGPAIDPLRRMMRADSEGSLSTWRSSCSAGTSHRSKSSRSSHRSHRSKHGGKRRHKRRSESGGGGGGDDDDDDSAWSESGGGGSELTEEEMLSELDDMLDAMGSDLSPDGPPAHAQRPPSPPRQLKLGDLSVRELRVLIASLGGDEARATSAVEKSELLALAASALASAPLPLIDETLTTLGLNGLQQPTVAPRMRIELGELKAEQLRKLVTKLHGGQHDPSLIDADVATLVPRALVPSLSSTRTSPRAFPSSHALTTHITTQLHVPRCHRLLWHSLTMCASSFSCSTTRSGPIPGLGRAQTATNAGQTLPSGEELQAASVAGTALRPTSAGVTEALTSPTGPIHSASSTLQGVSLTVSESGLRVAVAMVPWVRVMIDRPVVLRGWLTCRRT